MSKPDQRNRNPIGLSRGSLNNLSPYIWHQDFCPAPAHEGDCCCGYAEAKALAEEMDRGGECPALRPIEEQKESERRAS